MARRQKFGDHPKSLEAQSARDPELREKIRNGRRKAQADYSAFETWARRGFAAVYESE